MQTPHRPDHVPVNIDDGDCGDIFYLVPETDASPVINWLAHFTGDGTLLSAREGLATGYLEPALAPGLILEAMAGHGIVPGRKRSWTHIDAMLSTPHENVFVGVSLGDPPGERFRLGLRRPDDGSIVSVEAATSAVRASIDGLHRALASVPAMPPVPDLRPFRAEEGQRSFAQLAARKGIAVDPAAALAVDRLQEAANAGSLAMARDKSEGILDAEACYERAETERRAWLVEAHRLVGADAVTGVLGEDAVPAVPPPDAPGWPYWLRSTIAAGREKGPRKDSLHLMQAIQYLCRAGGHSAIDAAYRRLDVSEISEMAMITLLRTPFTSRGMLREWVAFRERARAELYARGRNGDGVLVGLGKPGEGAEADEAGQAQGSRA